MLADVLFIKFVSLSFCLGKLALYLAGNET